MKMIEGTHHKTIAYIYFLQFIIIVVNEKKDGSWIKGPFFIIVIDEVSHMLNMKDPH